MQAMWRKYGKPGGAREGYVDRPYTIADVEATLAEVSADRAFAHDFFARYIQGHEVADYARLLSRAGFGLRKRNPGRAWLGDLRVESRGGGARVAALVAPTWPIYAAGIDEDDDLQQMDGTRITGSGDVSSVLQRHKPGDTITIVYMNRAVAAKTAKVTLAEDPHVDVVGLEPDVAQRAFRDRWLNSQQSQAGGR